LWCIQPIQNDEPNVRNTDIYQSILFDPFDVDQTNHAKGILDQTSEVIDYFRIIDCTFKSTEKFHLDISDWLYKFTSPGDHKIG
jgi:hypothetical protein